MMNNTPSGAKKHHETTKPESCRTAKMLSFSSSSFSYSDGIVQICVTLSQWFLHKTAAFPLSSVPAHHFFYKIWSLMRWFELLTEEVRLPLRRHFFLVVYTCAQITWPWNVIITQDCWIRNTVGVQRVLEDNLVWSMILQPILHTSTKEACEDGLVALW